MALTSLLLNDGRGPLTTASDPAILERAVRATLAALNEDPHPRQKEQLPVGTKRMNWEERINQAGAPGPVDRRRDTLGPIFLRSG